MGTVFAKANCSRERNFKHVNHHNASAHYESSGRIDFSFVNVNSLVRVTHCECSSSTDFSFINSIVNDLTVVEKTTQNSAYPAKNSVALPTPSFKPKPMPNATALHTYTI